MINAPIARRVKMPSPHKLHAFGLVRSMGQLQRVERLNDFHRCASGLFRFAHHREKLNVRLAVLAVSSVNDTI